MKDTNIKRFTDTNIVIIKKKEKKNGDRSNESQNRSNPGEKRSR